MNQAFSIQMDGITQTGSLKNIGDIRAELPPVDSADEAAFLAEFKHYMDNPGIPAVQAVEKNQSLGQVVAQRVTGLASEFQKDQQHVSKMLEQATRTGDSMHLMRAMLSLNDYQLRVQVVSKAVGKAASSIEQLTKLQ